MEGDERLVRITQEQFDRWKKKCSDRALEMKKRIFEDDEFDMPPDSGEGEQQTGNTVEEKTADENDIPKVNVFRRIIRYRLPGTIDPYSDSVYLFYQFLVAMCFTYNACSIPLRMAFPYQTESNVLAWLIIDYTCDLIYLLDIVVFQIRCQYIQGGNLMQERKDTKSHYLKSKRFRLDVASVFPTDLIYIFLGFHPAARLNRLCKYESYFEFNNKFEMVLEQAYIFRIARTTFYLLYFIHLDACLYYFVSYMQDFKSPWGYAMIGNSYIRCYYWAFLTTVNLGNAHDPTNNFELLYQMGFFFFGLFIFSIVIGQVRDSVHALSAEHNAYRRMKNDCMNYMQKYHIPGEVQGKVRKWFEYTWDTQKILDEGHLMNQMPIKMRTEIAINVHIGVLSKVALFKECDRQLLHDLVLKLRPVLYLPGEYICRKGEIGREMYIISKGTVQVVGDSTNLVFATLFAGTAFGEISLLAIGGANRRTANIYSPGYATLFILDKSDLNEVVQNYPTAQSVLRRKAKEMLNKDNKKDDKEDVLSYGTEPQFLKLLMLAAKNSKKDLKTVKKISQTMRVESEL